MQKRTLINIFAISAVLGSALVMAQAYRWTDAEGVVHYSDKPTDGAEEIYLPESDNGPRPYARPSRPAPQAESNVVTQVAPFVYESIEVSAPAAEETLWNIGGILSVSLNVQPALKPGHRVRVYVDGNPQMVSGSNFELQEIYRGVHNIQAEILDENGELMGRSLPNRFYVQQNTINR